ncbi:DUF7931 domain-containing protein [Aurantivibrio infirmus]
MTETVSPTDDNLILLDGLDSYSKHANKILGDARREIVILSNKLDFSLYDQSSIAEHITQVIRNDRNAKVKILIKDIRPLVERGHQLLNLARRLSSKVKLRKLLIEPENDSHAYLIADNSRLLYQHDDEEHVGFVNYKARPEAKKLLREFTYLWEQHSDEDPSLRSLVI